MTVRARLANILIPIRNYLGSDQDTAMFANSVRDSINALNQVPIANGLHIRAVSLNGSTKVAHGLGRIPVGYIVTSNDTPTNVYEAGERTDLFLTLAADTPCQCALWIF